MLSKILDWAYSIQPEWAGFVVFATVSGMLVLPVAAIMVAVVALTNGWALLAIPAFVAYAFYIALFRQ